MRDLQIADIASYVPHRLYCLTSRHQIKYGERHKLLVNGISLDDDGSLNIEFLHDDDLWYSNWMNKVFPLLRPLSDLTKTIKVNGEEFVPLVELAKIALPTEYELGDFWVLNGYVGSYGGLTFGYTHEGFYISDRSFHEQCNQLVLFKKLYEWHFDIYGLIEKGLSLNLNDYQ